MTNTEPKAKKGTGKQYDPLKLTEEDIVEIIRMIRSQLAEYDRRDKEALARAAAALLKQETLTGDGTKRKGEAGR